MATAVWSILDRARVEYSVLHKWIHLFLRFAVGSEMVLYGMVKVVPLQMPFPFLTRLVEPFGNFSPMGVLWSSVGASPAYEMFVGSAEMLGGILLFFPRTALFGALICLADATEVFMLNMTYDVPVKLFSFHLILMTLLLLAPELGRIGRFFFLNREVGPSNQPALFRGQRATRVAVAVQAVFGLLIVVGNGYRAWTGWHAYGGGAPKSALYGIWNVDQASGDGWRRVIFDRPNGIAFQGVDDSFVNYAAAIDAQNGRVDLTKANDRNWKASLRFEKSGSDRLTLDGALDGRKIHLQLRLLDPKKLLLVSRGFHWVQEYPFNR